jgi:hypothetical protein
MTDARTLNTSAEAISEEIGLDLSYLTDESERNFLLLAAPIGYVLLSWFLEGVADAVKDELHDSVRNAGSQTTAWLLGRIRRVLRREEPATDAQLLSATEAAVERSRTAAAEVAPQQLAEVVNRYEQELVQALVDEGMPATSAVRIAQRVRAEAEVQFTGRGMRGT